MRYIGLDVHKTNITACVLTTAGKVKFEKDFKKNGDRWDLEELLGFGDKDGFCVMMESGTYAYQPFRYFSDRGVRKRGVWEDGPRRALFGFTVRFEPLTTSSGASR